MTSGFQRLTMVLALVAALVMTGCGDSGKGPSTETAATTAPGDQANAGDQPTSLPAKPTMVGPQPTALPTQQLPMKGKDADGDGFYTPVEFKSAIFQLIDYYEWPVAYTPDTVAFSKQFDASTYADAGALHEIPGEYVIVGRMYQCAWSQAWLDSFTDGDTATMDLSIQKLRDELVLNPLYGPSMQQSKERHLRQGQSRRSGAHSPVR